GVGLGHSPCNGPERGALLGLCGLGYSSRYFALARAHSRVCPRRQQQCDQPVEVEVLGASSYQGLWIGLRTDADTGDGIELVKQCAAGYLLRIDAVTLRGRIEANPAPRRFPRFAELGAAAQQQPH